MRQMIEIYFEFGELLKQSRIEPNEFIICQMKHKICHKKLEVLWNGDWELLKLQKQLGMIVPKIVDIRKLILGIVICEIKM